MERNNKVYKKGNNFKQDENVMDNNQKTSEKKSVKGRVIRTSGYRHKKRRNKHLFISEDDTPSQIRYNYKYERINSEKRREQQEQEQEQQMKDMMKNNQSKNTEKDKKNHSKGYNKYEYHPHQLFTIYKEYSNDESTISEVETVDESVYINDKYPLNHLYEAFIYLGHSKMIRRSKAWYDSIPLYLVEDNSANSKSKNNQICVRKLSLSIASAYALNNSPKSWHLIDYYKRNPETNFIKAGATLSKNLMDKISTEKKKDKKKMNKSIMEDAFENCPISLIHYPPYNPFDAEDGAQEDYEPYYDYQIKLNNYINNLQNENTKKKNLNTNNKNISSSSTKNINRILSPDEIWNNYVHSRKVLREKNLEIRSNAIKQLQEATQRRKRMVQRPSPNNKKQTVTFNFDSLHNYKKQNQYNKKQYNNKKFNKNSTYAKYVENYSIINDINKLTQPNNGGYPINYNNVIERINNYYNNENTISSPTQQQNTKPFKQNTHYNGNYNNNTNRGNNNNNNNNNKTRENNIENQQNNNKNAKNNNNKNQQKQSTNANTTNSSKKVKSSTPLRSNNSTSSSNSSKPIVKQNNNKTTYLMSKSKSPQQQYFSNNYVYGTNQNNSNSSIQNKPKSFNQNIKQKYKNNSNNETMVKNKESSKKAVNVS
ncbi:hypothetical protein BCR32DRAFT_264224 [Anaeromyces robustus]|uniref:Uncharacterized protein n=1 Tax=Anaeromyces robustus TaxID=1754192 RepID=A0A1Y1XNY2_9FUNG|nr:hypothetical protein BCR32DRAFT_264224 [Anaeromyces robustus]|eukprot:ORX87459.1 hypothetical protein BCR32DRAFT_264224 [Anaeromyces robustus]